MWGKGLWERAQTAVWLDKFWTPMDRHPILLLSEKWLPSVSHLDRKGPADWTFLKRDKITRWWFVVGEVEQSLIIFLFFVLFYFIFYKRLG